MTRVAIMQPTYLPWLGYFGLLSSVDLFIYLDNVQFSKRSWQQRNQIKTTSGAQWLSVPVLSRGKRDQVIRDTLIDSQSNFAKKHSNSISISYSKARHYSEFSASLLDTLNGNHSNLSELNIELIGLISSWLGITTPILKASELECSGNSAALLASLCSTVGAKEYISPPGSRCYLEASSDFEAARIPIYYFRFEHPKYSQLHGDFLPFMSVIDMIFNCGAESLHAIKSSSFIQS